MGWASDAFWRDLNSVGITPNVPVAVRRSARNTKEEKDMSNFREVSDSADLVKVCEDRHIIGQTDKAIQVRVGQTLYGEPITTFYPKSLCQVRFKPNGSFELFVPKWVNRDRRCAVGEFRVGVTPGFEPLPF